MKNKFFYQLDGSKYSVPMNTCRGCWMNENSEKLPKEVFPIWEDQDIIVRQDIEWPIPGFLIVSVKEHIGSISDLSPEVSRKLFFVIQSVRKALKEDLKIERAQIYHEEKINSPHVHFWILPLWENIMEENNIYPKIYEGNIKEYIDLFNYETSKDNISSFNKIIKKRLSNLSFN